MDTRQKLIVLLAIALLLTSASAILFMLSSGEDSVEGRTHDRNQLNKTEAVVLFNELLKDVEIPTAHETTSTNVGETSTTVGIQQTTTIRGVETTATNAVEETTTTMVQDILAPVNPADCGSLQGDERSSCEAVNRRDIRYCPREEYTNYDSFVTKEHSCIRDVFDSGIGLTECRLFSSDPIWGPVCCRYLAVKNSNPTVCELCSEKDDEKNLCYKTFQQYRSKELEQDINICMNFSRYSDVCIRRNAIRSLDFSICNLYPADSVKEIGCNYETCMKSMDDNPGFECCKFIPYAAGSGQWYKNSCYIRRAGIDKDLKWCKYMVSADATVGLYDECYKAVAESKEDIGICSMVEKADVRDDCLLGLATEKTDCDTITNQEKKGGCQKKIV